MGLAHRDVHRPRVPQANWADHTDQVDTIALPDCAGSVSSNSTSAPDLSILKNADDARSCR